MKPGGISCQEVVELVTAYLDGALVTREVQRAWRPTCSCAARASEYVEQVRATATARRGGRARARAAPGPRRAAGRVPELHSRDGILTQAALKSTDGRPMNGSRCPDPPRSRPSPRSPRSLAPAPRPQRRPLWPAHTRVVLSAPSTLRPSPPRSRPVRDGLRVRRADREPSPRPPPRPTTIDDALLACVEHVCRWTGWPVGHVYFAGKEEHDPLKPSHLWHLGHPTKFEAFRALTEATDLPSGIGLPGRVAATGRPAWIVDVQCDPNFPRAEVADRGRPQGRVLLPDPDRRRHLRRHRVLLGQRRHAGRPPARGHRAHRPPARPRDRRRRSSPRPCASPRAASARSPSPPPTRSSPPTRTATSSPGTAAPS